MKTNILQIAPGLLTLLLILVATSVFAQRAITWKGGFPGKKNDWYCAQNWSTYSVPDAFSDVIIPDVSTSTFAPPVIVSGQVEINSLLMLSNSTLTIARNASLVVAGPIEGVTPSGLKGDGKLIREEMPEPNKVKLVAHQ